MATPPLTQPTLPTIGSGLPAVDAVKESIDMGVAHSNTQVQDLQDSLSRQNRFPTELVNGLTITDLINQVNTAQANSQYLLDNDPNKNGGGANKGFDIHQAIGGFFDKLHSTQSFGSKNTPLNIGEGKDFERYASNKNFQTFGYTPGMGEGQEYKYGNAMTWGDTMGRAFAGGGHLAYDTFIEGWKGWGRMVEALGTWDASKLMGSEQERYDMAQHQEEIMNKYAIYDNETSKDSFWNRQFFGTMLQQSGFAVGAGLQFAMENYLTAGFGSVAKGLGLGSMMVAKGVKATATAGELINDTRKVMNTVTNTERVTNGIAGIAKKLVPLYGTVDDMVKMGKAGAGGMQMAMTFGGGIKRGLSEFNMARSESIFEAAGTYKQLKDRLVEDFVATNGREPSNEELEKIKQSAEDASSDNFVTNLGVLSVMNRIQFDNMFNSFNKGRKIFGETATYLGDEAFTVAGKIEGKAATRAYNKSWFFGRLGAVKSIATDFGGKKAAWEATKMLGKGLTRIEGSEGVQELIQEASSKGLEDYYYDLYHGKKGYTGRVGAVMDSVQNPLTDTQGMKTFLMGALTGALISPMSKIVTKANESAADAYKRKQDPNYKSRKDQVEENLNLVNQLYKDPTQFRKEWIANTKVQNKAAATMEEAAKNHNEYVFYNAKDSAFAKTIASAIKLDMFDSVRDTLTEYGDNLSDEDFKKAFDLDPSSQNRKDVKSFMNNIGQQMDEYYTTFNNLKDEYGDRVLPELYKNNSPEKYAEAKLAKYALDDAIEMLATNVHKSKQAVKRASALQTEIGKNPNIGGSSVEVLSKMGSEQAIIDNISLIEKEIAATEKFVTDGGTLTKEQKDILKDKKEELQHAKTWQEAHADIIDNSDESYSPAAEKRAYQAYADLVNIYNKRSKLNAVVSKQDVDNNFIKIIDYMRLNKDNKAYVDAMNLLADPNNMKLITSSIISANRANNEIFKQEHKAEVKKNGDTEEEVHADDIEELAKQLEVNKTTSATDLEKHLQEEYAKAKKATEGKGITMPDYELWKKTAGVPIAKRFEEAKKGKPKPPGPEAGGGTGGGTSTETKEDKSKIVVNGQVATMLEMNKVDGKVYVDYLLDVADETGQTEEQYEARRGTLVIDAKTLKATDSDGNPVEYSIGKPKDKPTEAEELDRINKITDPEEKKVAQIKYIMSKLTSGVGEASANKIKEYVDRILKGESRESIIQGLPKSFVDGIDQLLAVQQTTTDVDPRVAEIEERRKKNLEDNGDMFDYVPKEPREDGKFLAYYVTNKESRSFDTYEEAVKWINSKYDEEIAALKPVSDIEAKKAEIEKKHTFNLSSVDDISDGVNSSFPVGKPFLNSDKVSSQLSVGDKIEFFAERKRTGVWNGKAVVEDGTNNSWGIMGILGIPNGSIKNLTKINAELAALNSTSNTENKKADIEKQLGKNLNEEEFAEKMFPFFKANLAKQEKVKLNVGKNIEFIADSNLVPTALNGKYPSITSGQAKIDGKMSDGSAIAWAWKDLKNTLNSIQIIDEKGNVIKEWNKEKLNAELAALENEEPTEIEIEPEYEAKDYDKVYVIARAIAQGKNVNTPENLQLITNYPKLLEQFLKLEQQRQEALKADPSKASSINAKYDGLIKNLVDEYGDRIPEEEDDNVPAYAQGLDRIKKAQMEADTMYANQEYQIGYRQITPSNSLANTTDIVKVETKSGTVTYTRDRVNTNYVFDVATKEFPPGTQIVYRVMTEQEDYDKMEPNRLTGEKYDRAKIFDKDGKVKQEAYDDVPIGIYAEIRGKEVLIGTVHEPLWIGYRINGRYPHIASPDVNDPKVTDAHVAVEVTNNREIRKAILDAYNLNSKFVISGVVSEKSSGILRMVNDAGLLKDRVNSKIGEGGSNNRHGYFAIVRNETLQTEVNVEATDVVETEAFSKNASQYSGVPALMLPTPNGQYMPTFIGLPKIDKNQAEFIMEAWKAFTGKKENQELVDAVYKAVDRVMSDKPDVNILTEYLNQYYVNLERKKPLSKIGNGSDVQPGQAIFDIDSFGNIKLEVKDLKTKEWVKTTIRTEKDIPANMLELLQNLRTTIKFNDRRNDSLRGINSTEKITFLSMENGKLISKDMTYNENLLDKATTFVDKGIQSETAEKDWVYFANPVVKMQMTALETPDPDATDIEETPPTDEDLNDQPEEDLGAALLAALNTTNATEEQVEEKKEECTTDKGTDLQSEINNLI